jgi:ribonucleoside-diphosphate reductase alpha chain
LQATYTDFPYLAESAKELTESESLLGVSITAMMENPDVLLVPEYQKTASKLCVETNKKWAELLGVKQAARVTVVKPEGTSTLALGSMASGIHPAHARQMFRRVQMNKLDPVYKHFNMYNSQLCEEGVWSKNKTDDVVTFPINVPESSLVKADLTALSHLQIILDTQINWILPGTTEANKRPVSHNVSCTVVVKPHEWEEVEKFIFENRQFFTAVSLIPASGDKDYKQAPMEAVSTEADQIKFDSMLKSYLPVDYSLMMEEEDNTDLMGEMSCVGGRCELI